ncbi:PAS domain-containing protein [Emcibacter sp.]|uniref:PAS domain-containing protein n=1 Tax=Emcibacter sp. TaxID=1979954 RepID=UPI003A94991B
MVVHFNQLARELANDNTQYLEDYMVRQGFAKPHIQKDPAPGTLPCQKIRYAYQYWTSVRENLGDIPSRAGIRPSGLGIALGNICLLEPLDDGRDYRYRLFGSNIAHFSKYDLQGMTMSEALRKYPKKKSGDDEFHLAIYQCCQVEARPYYAEYVSQNGKPWLWRRLTLPLSDGHGNIVMLMNCLSPEDISQAPVTEEKNNQQQSIA